VALFLVFGFGLLLEEAGLSMAMGAFLEPASAPRS
jgi:glutathione-regulated potassium-efflux system ancillary protein KefC